MTRPPLDATLFWRLPGLRLPGQATDLRFYACTACGWALVRWCAGCPYCAAEAAPTTPAAPAPRQMEMML